MKNLTIKKNSHESGNVSVSRKSQTVSALDSIKGVGEKTRTALLTKFRSFKRVTEADLDELASVIGPAKASIVYSAIHPDTDQNIG